MSFLERTLIPPALISKAVHIWSARLSVSDQGRNALLSCLNDEERARAERFVQQIHTDRYIASTGLLRHVLAAYLNSLPEDIEFTRGEHGKPYVQKRYDGRVLQFNISHSGDYVVMAVGLDTELGIDIEQMRDEGSSWSGALVDRFFTEDEQEAYHALPETEQVTAFLRGWTRKESYIKGIGLGLSYPIKHFSVSFAENPENCFLKAHHDPELAKGWVIRSFSPFPRVFGAIAIRQPSFVLKQFQL